MKRILLLLLLLPMLVEGQIITTIAGNGNIGYSGDGSECSATEVAFNRPLNLKFDHYGNLYIADDNNNVIRKISTSGIITTVVGNGYGAGSLITGGYAGDGGPATTAELWGPTDIVFDAMDNMYISDNSNQVIRKISTSGIITTIAGTGVVGYNGDNQAATAAQLNDPFGLVFDGSNNLYFSDGGNRRVRKINTSGIITTVAGNGTPGITGDGGLATNAQLRMPCWLAISPSGDIYIPDHISNTVRKINNMGIITTVAGNGGLGASGDGGPATAASIQGCEAIVFDNLGNYYISSYVNCSIRKVNADGIISTVVGNDTCGYSGDRGPATAAHIEGDAVCSAVDAYGNLYIADSRNNRIRRVVYDEAAVNEVNKAMNNLRIYPNPAQNQVTIKSTTAIEGVEVVNMIGQVVTPTFGKGSGQAASSKEVLLDIRSLPAGVYFVKVNGADGYRDGGRFLKE